MPSDTWNHPLLSGRWFLLFSTSRIFYVLLCFWYFSYWYIRWLTKFLNGTKYTTLTWCITRSLATRCDKPWGIQVDVLLFSCGKKLICIQEFQFKLCELKQQVISCVMWYFSSQLCLEDHRFSLLAKRCWCSVDTYVVFNSLSTFFKSFMHL